MVKIYMHTVANNLKLVAYPIEHRKILLFNVLHIMVTKNKANLTIEFRDPFLPNNITAKSNISQVKYPIIRSNNGIPILNKLLVHFLYILKWTIAKLYNLCMSKMSI